jgi:hypothetical protein
MNPPSGLEKDITEPQRNRKLIGKNHTWNPKEPQVLFFFFGFLSRYLPCIRSSLELEPIILHSICYILAWSLCILHGACCTVQCWLPFCMVFLTFWHFNISFAWCLLHFGTSKHLCGSLEGSLGFHLGCHLRFHLGFHAGFYLGFHVGFHSGFHVGIHLGSQLAFCFYGFIWGFTLVYLGAGVP